MLGKINEVRMTCESTEHNTHIRIGKDQHCKSWVWLVIDGKEVRFGPFEKFEHVVTMYRKLLDRERAMADGN